MHNTSDKYLLQIEPKKPRFEKPMLDDLTLKMQTLLRDAKRGPSYRGFHLCTGCNEATSASYDLFVGPYITNSLAIHYLMWHRDEVPESEIEKLKGL